MLHPLFVAQCGALHIWDVDGNEYIDFVGSWGPMILGCAHRRSRPAREQLDRGTSYGAPTELEVELARRSARPCPSIEMVRMVSSGTEATMSAIRLARGYTGREKFIKFDGNYHGHSDALLVAAGSGLLTLGVPGQPGVTKGADGDTIVLPYNDVGRRSPSCSRSGRAGRRDHRRADRRQHGRRSAAAGLPRGLRELCTEYGVVLIFDEVITGFRVAWGGAQERYGVTPDLTTLGKIIGGGLPVGAFGGSREIMETLAPIGPVYQAGTLSGNPLAMVAGAATLGGSPSRASTSSSRPPAPASSRACARPPTQRAAPSPSTGSARCYDVLLRRPGAQLRRRQGRRHRRLRRLLAAHARGRRLSRAVAVRSGDDLACPDRRGPGQGCGRRGRLVRRSGRPDVRGVDTNDVPSVTVPRLALYLRKLRELRSRGVDRVSSRDLAEMIDLNAAQIRKDFSYFGEFGTRGVGYEVPVLVDRDHPLPRPGPHLERGHRRRRPAGHRAGAIPRVRRAGFRLVGMFDSSAT